MAMKFRMHETLENAFITGLLLTGSIERAEAAILESVRMSCPDELFSETLFRRAVHYSIDQNIEARCEQQKRGRESAGSILPFELRCILFLSQNLRYCYVLRVLLGLPREVCAWLLHLEMSQVDQHTCDAMQELPLIQKRERRLSEISSEKTFFKQRTKAATGRLSGNNRRYGQPTPIALFRSAQLIHFDKQTKD